MEKKKNSKVWCEKLCGYFVGSMIITMTVVMVYLFVVSSYWFLFGERYTETMEGKVIDKEYSLVHGNMGGSVRPALRLVVIQTRSGKKEVIPIWTGSDFADSEIHKGNFVEFEFIYREPVRIWTPFGMIIEHTEKNGKTFNNWSFKVKSLNSSQSIIKQGQVTTPPAFYVLSVSDTDSKTDIALDIGSSIC